MELTLKRLLEQAEFTETRKGYDRGQVDDFLDKAVAMATKVEARLTQALDQSKAAPSASGPSAAELEAEVERRVQARLADLPAPAPAPVAHDAPSGPSEDETAEEVRRTLVLAQRTADAAVREAREDAAKLLSDAQERAAKLNAEAEAAAANAHAGLVSQIEDERRAAHDRLAAEIGELESARGPPHRRHRARAPRRGAAQPARQHHRGAPAAPRRPGRLPPRPDPRAARPRGPGLRGRPGARAGPGRRAGARARARPRTRAGRRRHRRGAVGTGPAVRRGRPRRPRHQRPPGRRSAHRAGVGRGARHRSAASRPLGRRAGAGRRCVRWWRGRRLPGGAAQGHGRRRAPGPARAVPHRWRRHVRGRRQARLALRQAPLISAGAHLRAPQGRSGATARRTNGLWSYSSAPLRSSSQQS
ncbi:DivIVA domain-containing protein [Aquihabitans sp. G128]|nr:DivIVA domain-containing protein [Aquihabitans sp. G128]